MKTLRIVVLFIICIVAAALWGCMTAEQEQDIVLENTTGTQSFGSTDERLAWLYETQQHDVYVTGVGNVEYILSDDTEGDQHQRFILRLTSGQSLLVAHNIDIAPRVEPLAVGDEVHFAGIYEYNHEGGVIHWTHHDPTATHRSGYLRVGDVEFS